MGGVDLDECIARLMRLELLGEDLVRDLCDRLRLVLVNESNVQHIAAPVTVVGDVHGYASTHPTLERARNPPQCPSTAAPAHVPRVPRPTPPTSHAPLHVVLTLALVLPCSALCWIRSNVHQAVP